MLDVVSRPRPFLTGTADQETDDKQKEMVQLSEVQSV